VHETQCTMTDDGHHEMQVSGVYLTLMSSLFMYSGILMSSLSYHLINVFLNRAMIDIILRRSRHRFAQIKPKGNHLRSSVRTCIHSRLVIGEDGFKSRSRHQLS
jgi:hypothetical protein